jgi:hypothetical protein
MADDEKKVIDATNAGAEEAGLQQLPSGVDDAGVIEKGTIDPVYEAKARVLNHAVSPHKPIDLDGC